MPSFLPANPLQYRGNLQRLRHEGGIPGSREYPFGVAYVWRAECAGTEDSRWGPGETVRHRVIQTMSVIVLLLVAPTIAAAAQTYVVQSGDTLWSIARRYGVSVEAFVSANRLPHPDSLQLGQRLIIPGASFGGTTVPAVAAARVSVAHVVVVGETLWSIARRYGVPVDDLVERNRLADPDALRLGQRLVVSGPLGRAIPAVRAAASAAVVRRPIATSLLPSRGVKWGSALLANASRLVGIRYRWGGMSPRGFDCSGFIGYVMRSVGVVVPRTTYAMWAEGRPVARDQLKVGDIVFFQTTRPGPSHAGIYIGNKQFIHSSSGFARVTVTSLDYRYYQPRYFGARRF